MGNSAADACTCCGDIVVRGVAFWGCCWFWVWSVIGGCKGRGREEVGLSLGWVK